MQNGGKRIEEVIQDYAAENAEKVKALENLRQIALDFRKGLLGDRTSASMCFIVCAPLQSYLAQLGIITGLLECYIRDKEGNGHHHYFLLLQDGNILDPTADQFTRPDDSPMPEVYIGELPAWYEIRM
jgi:hypothetical protein